MIPSAPKPMRFAACGPLRGAAAAPGDKSISHRALLLAALADGRSRIAGLSRGTDVAATADALRALGAVFHREGMNWEVDGFGPAGAIQPKTPLDLGNSGTSARLLMGLVAGQPVRAALTGDPSLLRRPMGRVIAPLREMGAKVEAASDERLPLIISGAAELKPIRHTIPIASAQVKSALLLATLNAPGESTLIEPVPSRDHTERMLTHFGAPLRIGQHAGVRDIRLTGPVRLRPAQVRVPGDFSAAAFLLVAALIVPGSKVRIDNVLLSPLRTGLLRVLRSMGAKLAWTAAGSAQGEPFGSIEAAHSALTATGELARPAEAMVASMIDEFPIFLIAAAFAAGTTRVTGLAELRVKESDRISAMAAGLTAIGAKVEEIGDGISVTGGGGALLRGGATIDPQLDHRVAMSFAVAGLHCREPVTISDMDVVRTSFPGFVGALADMGVKPC